MEPAAYDPFSSAYDPFSSPTYSSPAQVGANTPRAAAARKSGIPVWVMVLIGAGLAVPLLCCGTLGVIGYAFQSSVTPTKVNLPYRSIEESLAQSSPLSPSSMPALGEPEEIYPSGVKCYYVLLRDTRDLPGHEMQLRVFVPPGDHAPASLPLVVNSPAGTPLLHGSYLDQHEIYEDECLPFAEAGFVVIQYSLDGSIPDGVDPSEQQNYQPFLETAYQEFYSAGAGVVNGRNTIDYALARLPYVDPKRIVCSGHSSAGNVSLLLAAYDHRVSRCIAFAAAYDTETRLGELRGEPWARRSFPSLGSFIADTSPMNKVGKYHCPLFVFHAKDDSNVPFQDAERFDFSLKSAGKSVKFVTSDTGEHYDSMINTGIPAAIQWLKDDKIP